MKLTDIKTIHEVSKEFNIPVPTLNARLKLTSFDLIENVDFRRMGKGQGVLLSPIGVEKIIKIKRNSPQDFEQHYVKWKNKEETVVEIAKLLNINQSTFYRFVQIYELKIHRESKLK